MSKNKNNKIKIVAVLLMLAVVIFFFKTIFLKNVTLSITPVNGGTILGVSYLQFFSNNNQLNGVPAYLVNLVVNNGGESLQGTINNYSTTSGSFVNNINSYSGTNYQAQNPNQQIIIDTKLNSLSESIPYDYAGYHLYKYYYINESLSYTLPNAPTGLICNSGETNDQIFVGCYDYFSSAQTLTQEVASLIQVLAYDCQNQYTGSILTASNSTAETISLLGLKTISSGLYYNVSCVQPYLGEIGIVLNPSTANYNYNVSIFFSNSTFTKTLYLTNTNPQTNYNNILYAQVYGVESTGQGIQTGNPPTLVEYLNKTYDFVNSFSTATGLGEAYSQYTPSTMPISAANLDLQPFGLNNGEFTIQNVYSLSNLQSQIYLNNEKVNNLLTPLQPSNSYYGINYSQNTATAEINLMNNPPVYPEAQLIAKVSTLGIFQAITEPKIISINPSSIYFITNSQQDITLTVQNLQDVSGSFYGHGYCGSVDFNIPNTPIGTSQTITTNPITLQSPVNNNLYNNETVNCEATIYSSFGIYNSSINFTSTVAPECSAGSIYQNNTNCKNEFPNGGNKNSSCLEGYENINNKCVVIPPNCGVNETANYSTFPPHCNSSSSNNSITLLQLMEYVVVFLIIISIIYLLLTRNSGKKYYRNYYRRR